jgi:hemolysin III
VIVGCAHTLISGHSGECSDRVLCTNCKIGQYLSLCKSFGVSVDPAIVTGIYTKWETLRVTAKNPSDPSLLPIVFCVSNYPLLRELQIGTHVSVAHRGDGNWICRGLSVGLPKLTNLTVLDLQRLGIDGVGLSQLSHAICQLPNLTDLILRHNYLGINDGTAALVEIVQKGPQSLRFIDIACNSLGYMNVRRIELAAEKARNCPVELHIVDDEPRSRTVSPDARKEAKKKHHHGCCYEIDVEGNFVVEEVWNSVIHGLGAVLALIGTLDLTNKTKGQPDQVWWACLVYGLSATILFTASTLYHSTFLHERARRVFQMLDHCAIFILIAGTYTPIGLIALSNQPAAVVMVIIEWIVALLGIMIYLISAHFPALVKSLPYTLYEVVLYVVMGHMCFISYESIIVPLDKDIMYTLMLGGALYVIGVVFFIIESVKRIPLFHVCWHFFVLFAAICHFFSVRRAVVSRLYESAHTDAMVAAAPRMIAEFLTKNFHGEL